MGIRRSHGGGSLTFGTGPIAVFLKAAWRVGLRYVDARIWTTADAQICSGGPCGCFVPLFRLYRGRGSANPEDRAQPAVVATDHGTAVRTADTTAFLQDRKCRWRACQGSRAGYVRAATAAGEAHRPIGGDIPVRARSRTRRKCRGQRMLQCTRAGVGPAAMRGTHR